MAKPTNIPHDHNAIIQWLLEHNWPLVFWNAIGDDKGPREHNWQHKVGKFEDWQGPDKTRVGVKLGTQIAEGQFLTDIDIDWAPGAQLALAFLPATNFVFGRKSKPISHCIYLVNAPVATIRFEDPSDKTCLLEIRGTKADGNIGHQTMIPPSVWSKEGKREPLELNRFGVPNLYETAVLVRKAKLAVISMLLGKHLGKNGFGHEVRLAWAGFFIRAGVDKEDLLMMGRELSHFCNNLEIEDVPTVINTTVTNLQNPQKKVRGRKALAECLGPHGKAIVQKFCEWLGYEQDFVRDRNNRIIAKNAFNITRAVDLMGHVLSYDEFSQQYLMNGEIMGDPHWKKMLLDIEKEYHFQPPPEYFRMVVEVACMDHSFHPVINYLNTLTWDGVCRIDEWLINCAKAEDSLYVRAVSSIMLIAAVRRVRQPGCKYDELVVWESSQGTNKSSAAAMLCPKPEWFSDDLKLSMQSKELLEATLGKWIIEASELSGKRKTEVEQLKAMLSRRVDSARMAYGHMPVTRPRQFIFIGTTNPMVYLSDSTGGRRFWPVRVHRFDLKWIEENRDQLWAEAAYRESKGEPIRLREDLWPAAAHEQEQRREVDAWEPVISEYLQSIPVSTDGKIRVATSQLWDALRIPIERRDRMGSTRITDVMQRLGFIKTKVRLKGKPVEVGFIQNDVTRLDFSEIVTREPGEDDDVISNEAGF